MRTSFAAAALIAAFAAPSAGAQPAREPALAHAVSQVEAVVTVIGIDRKARTVTARGPQGRTLTINVPKEAKNFDKVKKGAQFKVRYAEALAVAVTPGGKKAQPAADQTILLSPEGGTPGGVIVNSLQVSATVTGLDPARRTIAVKGPGGRERELRVADEVQGLDKIRIGDVVTVVYADALAMEMLPYQSSKPDVPNDH